MVLTAAQQEKLALLNKAKADFHDEVENGTMPIEACRQKRIEENIAELEADYLGSIR